MITLPKSVQKLYVRSHSCELILNTRTSTQDLLGRCVNYSGGHVVMTSLACLWCSVNAKRTKNLEVWNLPLVHETFSEKNLRLK